MKKSLLSLSAGFAAFALAACGGGDAPVQSAHAEHSAASDHEIAVEAASTAKIDYVENFVLLDQEGTAHELYYNSDATAIVLMVQGNGCPIVRNAWSDFKAVRDEFESQGVHFLMPVSYTHLTLPTILLV